MRVKSISVKGLFGIFDHKIPLQSAERVTIIHGPNGFGKTVILRMIAALIDGKAEIFQHTPFEEFTITLQDDTSRIIRRHSDEGTKAKSSIVRLEFLLRESDGSEHIVAPSPPVEVPVQILKAVDRRVPGPYHLVGAEWTDGNERYSLADILKMFPQAKEALPRKYQPGLLFDVSRDLEVFFVETDRLAWDTKPRRRVQLYEPAYLETESERPSPRVKYYSDDIVQKIRTVLTEYARHSQEKDRTFPERLVRFFREGHAKLSEREILDRMSQFEQTRRRLNTLGLLERESGLHGLQEEDIRRAPEALTLYVADVEEKLKVFDDMARRIGALMDIVNARFRYKRLTLQSEQGFRVFSNLNKLIELTDLSSGEQHELVVLYELLFRGPQAGLILVDEPEISLHVAWQSRFLSDLISILEPTDSYAIVATHSPVIIGSRSDLTVELRGPEIPAEGEANA